ncbi:hypothetical protein [Serratia fonticola]|uniref:hypothetical protein n=1 Tax=Serratia fonticola TaxID=47917 RepID=UPI00301E26DA
MVSLTPTLPGFVVFVRNFMGITPGDLPDDSPFIELAFESAREFMAVYPCFSGIALLYTQAVYNLGGTYLLRWADDTPPSTYFDDKRDKYGMNAFRAGVLTSSSDESTSQSMAVGQAMSNLTLADLQMAQDPYGRHALAFLMELGDIWGIS